VLPQYLGTLMMNTFVMSVRLHDVTSQKTVNFMVIAVRTHLSSLQLTLSSFVCSLQVNGGDCFYLVDVCVYAYIYTQIFIHGEHMFRVIITVVI
jgi:hypothetical protein